jgi:putative Holliday junction resolvase
MANASPLPKEGVIFGLDHSRAATGVAIGSLGLGSTRALTVLKAAKLADRLDALETLYKEWAPVLIVVGLPLNKEGEEQEQTRLARLFADRLRERLACPIVMHDERYSTVVAESELKARGLSTRLQREIADAEAAREIIQGFLDSSHQTTHLRDPV